MGFQRRACPPRLFSPVATASTEIPGVLVVRVRRHHIIPTSTRGLCPLAALTPAIRRLLRRCIKAWAARCRLVPLFQARLSEPLHRTCQSLLRGAATTRSLRCRRTRVRSRSRSMSKLPRKWLTRSAKGMPVRAPASGNGANSRRRKPPPLSTGSSSSCAKRLKMRTSTIGRGTTLRSCCTTRRAAPAISHGHLARVGAGDLGHLGAVLEEATARVSAEAEATQSRSHLSCPDDRRKLVLGSETRDAEPRATACLLLPILLLAPRCRLPRRPTALPTPRSHRRLR